MIIFLGFSNFVNANSILPFGCTTISNFSITTGQSCKTNISLANTSVSATQISSLINNLLQKKLTIGSKGSDVKALQQLLKNAGFLSGKIDGFYGQITAKALTEFQKTNSNIIAIEKDTVMSNESNKQTTQTSLKEDIKVEAIEENMPSKVSIIATLASSSVIPSQFIPVENGIGNNSTLVTYRFTSDSIKTSIINELKFTVSVPNSIASASIGNIKVAAVNDVVDFTGLNLAVSSSKELNQDIYITYSVVGMSGVLSNITSDLSLVYIKYSTDGKINTTCTAFVAICGTVMFPISTPKMGLIGLNPTMILINPNTKLSAGTVEVADLMVITKIPIALKTFPIKLRLVNAELTSAGCAPNGIIIKDADNKIISTTNTSFDYNGSGANNCSDVVHGLAGGIATIKLDFSGYRIDKVQTFKIFLTIEKISTSSSLQNSYAYLNFGPPNLLSWVDAETNRYRINNMVNSIYFFAYPTNTTSIQG